MKHHLDFVKLLLKVLSTTNSLESSNSKCLMLLILQKLYEYKNEEICKEIEEFVQSVFQFHIYPELSNSIRICFYQLMEQITEFHSNSWICYYILFLAKNYKEEKKQDVWLSWFRSHLPSFDITEKVIHKRFMQFSILEKDSSSLSFYVDFFIGVFSDFLS